MGYIRTPKNEFGPCIFCDKAKIGDDDENLVVHRGEHAYVLLNLYPYNNGHLMITPYQHEENFDSETDDSDDEGEFVDKIVEIREHVRAVREKKVPLVNINMSGHDFFW